MEDGLGCGLVTEYRFVDRIQSRACHLISLGVFFSFFQFLHNLVSVCDNLSHLPMTLKQMNNFNVRSLKWDPAVHPWFPSTS